MKTFQNLRSYNSWQQILSKIKPKVSCMLIRDANNYIIGWGESSRLVINDKSCIDKIGAFLQDNSKEYCFGSFSYDIKNAIETGLESKNRDYFNMPECHLFVPEDVLICVNGKQIYFGEKTVTFFDNWPNSTDSFPETHQKLNLNPITTKDAYINNVEKLKTLIQQGDIYEVNYCVLFESDAKKFDSTQTFQKLFNKNESPFSAFLNAPDGTILSSSPERFVKKKGQQITSQPIKGTAKRGKNEKEDQILKMQLINNLKEIAENTMIVDLVRNDLSKIAVKNSVSVDELCALHSFVSVHQLISKISCTVNDDCKHIDILKALFPMGSMTGAPKINAMIYSEKFEDFKRSLYSGSVGVFQPNGNFDLNVIIRSLIFNNKSNKVYSAVGGAITIQSNPEEEYLECLLKLKATKDAVC